MSESSSTSQRTTTRTGFSAKDVSNFLSQGNTMVSRGTIGMKKPTEQTRTDTKIVTNRKALFGGRERTESNSSTGFLGAFSDISADELDRIQNVFNQRAKSIAERRSTPGRSGLFFRG